MEEGDLWQHEDIVLKRPEAAVQLPADVIAGALKLHFDGACRTRASQKEGAGGFIAWDRLGQCIGGGGRYYGTKRHTSNATEA